MVDESNMISLDYKQEGDDNTAFQEHELPARLSLTPGGNGGQSSAAISLRWSKP
jgi:hypothetical protein